MPALSFAVATLAVWRVTHFLVEEDGPFDLALRAPRSLLERTTSRAAVAAWVEAGEDRDGMLRR